jgi:hypothetical protein
MLAYTFLWSSSRGGAWPHLKIHPDFPAKIFKKLVREERIAAPRG